VLEDFDELALDVPDLSAIMAAFIGRAVVDEILPRGFLDQLTPPPGSRLEAMKKQAAGHLSQPHGEERLHRCWGSGAASPRAATVQEPRQLSSAVHAPQVHQRHSF
jgi:hypothetical protein